MQGNHFVSSPLFSRVIVLLCFSSQCSVLFSLFFLLYLEMSPSRKCAIEKFHHVSLGRKDQTASHQHHFPRLGVCGPWKHPQTKKRWTKAIVSLRWMSLCLHRCDGHLGRMTPLPSVSSGQWPLQYWNYSHLGHRGVLVPRSELSHLCLNGILIFFIWMMCFFIPLGRSVPQFYTWPAPILFFIEILYMWDEHAQSALIPNSFYKYMFEK